MVEERHLLAGAFLVERDVLVLDSYRGEPRIYPTRWLTRSLLPENRRSARESEEGSSREHNS
jgi:hypothetical protein